MRGPNLWRDVVIAIGGVGVCTAIRLLLWPVIGSNGAFFAIYLPAIMLAGAVAGTRALLIALATASAVLWVLKSQGHISAGGAPGDVVRLCIFIGASGLVGTFAVYLRRTLIQLWDAQARQQQLTDELKHRAAEAQAGEASFRTIADTIPALVFATDKDGRLTYVNSRFVSYIGQPIQTLEQDWAQFVHPNDRDRALAEWRESVKNARGHEKEVRLLRADGTYRWFLVRSSPFWDAQRRAKRWVGVWIDIQEQRAAAELQRTLRQEVSHRVKNSLALVSAVLRLQSRTLEGAAHRALDEAALRVNAVACVHDMLWRGAETGEIDLKPFLSNLCSAIGASAPRHRTVCSIEPALVSADCAGPLGLLLNELLTNAYKHAYPEGKEGEVRVRGSRQSNRRYRLEVADSGIGLPHDFEFADPRESLGMKVITSLAAQLGGELTATSAEPGAVFVLSFPLESRDDLGGR